MSDDLVAFLRARLDEDEQTARAAAEPEKWVELNRELRPHWYVQLWADPDQAAVIADPESSAYQVVATIKGMDEDDADHRVDHIARHDPARVLREVRAKRRMLDLHRPERFDTKGPDGEDRQGIGCPSCLADDAPCATLRLLAAVYAEHPEFREEWRP